MRKEGKYKEATERLASPVCNCVPLHSELQNTRVQFSRSVMSDSLQPHELQHARPPCGEGNGTPLQYYCLENPMGREAW